MSASSPPRTPKVNDLIRRAIRESRVAARQRDVEANDALRVFVRVKLLRTTKLPRKT